MLKEVEKFRELQDEEADRLIEEYNKTLPISPEEPEEKEDGKKGGAQL